MKITDNTGAVDWTMFGAAVKSFINEIYEDLTTFCDAVNGAAGKEILTEYTLGQICRGTKQPNINQLITMGGLCGVEVSIADIAQNIANHMIQAERPAFAPAHASAPSVLPVVEQPATSVYDFD